MFIDSVTIRGTHCIIHNLNQYCNNIVHWYNYYLHQDTTIFVIFITIIYNRNRIIYYYNLQSKQNLTDHLTL